MINCAHPTHFENTVAGDEPWLDRIGGLRANSSAKSHAELDESETLDDGNGALDREETKLFVKKMLEEVGESTDFSDEEFN